MSKIKSLIRIGSKFKSDLRQQYRDSMSYPDAGEIADIKRRGGDSPRDSINNAFNYIERSKSPDQARSRAEEMFGEFDVDGAIEEAGGLEKAFKLSPVKKKDGGLASAAKTITSGTTRSRNRTKPRGVGVAMRGYGKALK